MLLIGEILMNQILISLKTNIHQHFQKFVRLICNQPVASSSLVTSF
jgi:hypothetical protein